MNLKDQRGLGFTDEAATEDIFGIGDYINGLAQFISKCNTPMTISVQGAWGTGKTSVMKIIESGLDKNIKNVWFNTWQFSQFNMQDELALSLLSCLVSELDIKDEGMKKGLSALKTAATNVAKNAVYMLVENKVGGQAAETAKALLDGPENTGTDTAGEIKRLRERFSICVKDSLDREKKDRVVIFIDDLDRLEPKRAVELLEVLKIFLDCPSCVFVLAIDYDVVCRGVADKYGFSYDKAEENEKGKSFFDKIIQVPFKMPVARYNIRKYVESCFEKIGLKTTEEAELDAYVDLISSSVGTNPRAMKRLFNAFQLLTIVAGDSIKSQKSRQLLFAILCLQYCSEPVYNYIVQNSDRISAGMLKTLSEPESDRFDTEFGDYGSMTYDDLEAASPFMKRFFASIDSDGDGNIDENELSLFKNVLDFSTITSASDNEEPKRKKPVTVTEIEAAYLKYHKTDDLKRVTDVIEDELSNKTTRLIKNYADNNMSIKYTIERRISIWVLERVSGFYVEIEATPEFFDDLPTDVYNIIERRRLKRTYYANSQAVHIIVKNGDKQDEDDLRLLVRSCDEYCNSNK